MSRENAALSIYQEVLDVLSEAVMARDFNKFQRHVAQPHAVNTQCSQIVIETDYDMEKGFFTFSDSLRNQGVNHYIRLCQQADFLGSDYISGRHVSHIMRNAMPIIPSYLSKMFLRQINATWQVTQIDTELTNDRWPVHLPRVVENQVSSLESAETEADPREESQTALSVYQTFLDDLSVANMSHDYSKWTRLCTFPQYVHTEKLDKEIKHEDEVRPFFDMVSDIIKREGIDKLKRNASVAEFLDANSICGYHTATFYRDGNCVLGPVESRMILKRIGPFWYMESVTNSVSNDHFPYRSPDVSDKLVTLQEIRERSRKLLENY